MTNGYQEELVDHRLTEREWADEWKHLDHVRLSFHYLMTLGDVCIKYLLRESDKYRHTENKKNHIFSNVCS